MPRFLVRGVAAVLLALGLGSAAPGCDTYDPYTFCYRERERSSDIITRSYVYRTGNGVFCKAAVPAHDHYHCALADMDDHSYNRAWGYCPDGTIGPYDW